MSTNSNNRSKSRHITRFISGFNDAVKQNILLANCGEINKMTTRRKCVTLTSDAN